MLEADKGGSWFWRLAYRVFRLARRFALGSGFFSRDSARQRYHLGWLAPGKTLDDLKLHLHSKWDFGDNLVAFTDEDEVLSWRKLAGLEGQYHLRVFSDGEIRGHFEYTPEAHPIKHFFKKHKEKRRLDFLRFLGDFMVDGVYISQLKKDIE